MKITMIIWGTILVSFGIVAKATGNERENPAIAQLITQQAKEAVAVGIGEDIGPVTVDREVYFIFVLKNRIDPITCEIVPGSDPVKVYVDKENYPVSDISIARKIEIIDYVQQLQKDELQKDRLIKKIGTLQNEQRKIPDIDIRDASLDATIKLIKLINVPESIKDAIFKLVKGASSAVLRETLFSTMRRLRERTFEDFSEAINAYINILHELGKNKSRKIENYEDAKRIFDDYQLAKTKEKTATLLYKKLYDKTEYDIAERIGDRLLNELSVGFTDEVIAKHIEIDLIGAGMSQFDIPYKTALYTKQLADGCGGVVAVPDSNSPELPPVDGLVTALVIDRSGSMRGEKLCQAQEAAYVYVDTSPEENDLVSLIAFSADAESIIEPLPIVIGRENLKKNILSLSSGGNTNIGAGLTIALGHLSSCAQKNKTALLLSDGRHNAGTYKPEVAEFQKRGWQIHTVAFGRDADQEMLSWIANQTGGSFFPANLFDIVSVYQKINIQAHNGSVFHSYNDFIHPGERLTYNIPVEPDMKRVGFFTNWQGSRMETVLFSPNRTVINRSNISSWGRFIEGETHNLFEIDNPQSGNWQALITGYNLPPQGEQINFHSFCQSDIFSNILGFQPNYSLNEQVRIGVRLAEVIDGRLLPLRGAQVRAEIKKPSLSLKRFTSDIRRKRLQSEHLLEIFREVSDFTRKIVLFDDGLHGDVYPGDGIYANSYNDTTINGPYLVTIDCQGYTSQGKIVNRVLQESFQVGSIEKNSFTISEFLDLINQQGIGRQMLRQERKKTKERAAEEIINSLLNQLFKKR